ncbi:VanZ family protein [Curtobacterium sp. MCBA15_012]|uniref:VanZ family protein n=1 Tax=Curtobacterium sp. MCBA15_012 TaxID=1898738 RepID=UPI0011140B18|nr:VanZ family protein [Curtobacterium sp. MCBA15_012]WIB00739.1 VanZ family protein [Curtobacterium sp. MCBA15_012]
MTTARRTTLVRIVLCAAVALVVALLLVPGVSETLRAVAAHAAGALRALGHGTLAVDERFALAMAVTAVTAPLPLLLAGASRASRPDRVRQRAVVSGLLVLVLAVLAAAHADARVDRFRSVLVAGLVGVAVGALLDAAVHARERAAHASVRSKRVAWTLAAGYAVVVVLVATAGSPVDGGIQPWLTRAIAAGHRLGAPPWLGYDAVEFTANVVFFAPFGFLAVLLLGARRWWVGMVGGFVVSVCIETVQALFLPARFASVDDVLANTSGAVLGVLAGIVVLGRVRDRS